MRSIFLSLTILTPALVASTFQGHQSSVGEIQPVYLASALLALARIRGSPGFDCRHHLEWRHMLRQGTRVIAAAARKRSIGAEESIRSQQFLLTVRTSGLHPCSPIFRVSFTDLWAPMMADGEK